MFGAQGIKTFLYAVSIAAGIVIATAVWETVKAWLTIQKNGGYPSEECCSLRN